MSEVATAEVTAQRAIVHRTRGSSHGAITRLVSPGDLGEVLKPFIFLDRFEVAAGGQPPRFGMHPHSGIATLTYLMNGQTAYEDTTGEHGARGVLPNGGVEWMMAGGGVWHTGAPENAERVLGFQLWVAMPPELELAEAHITYLGVHLEAGETWRFVPPVGHTVAWAAVGEGTLTAPAALRTGDLAVFDDAGGAIEFAAQTDAAFVLGSGVQHPHELFMGPYSVHTSEEALHRGQAGIRERAQRLRQQGRM